jgi:hypothetical protein
MVNRKSSIVEEPFDDNPVFTIGASIYDSLFTI